ncbi:GntR family transcriptional regulator [Nonomuraea sp. NPDC050404]|uniref:TetR/AcrR family transcriptional regulator C-terminal domain-containing protein n=1 Tax=Nonomuraea sp. NPDC050404 TaxID=3155783 RepID=UPI0033ED9746
MSAFEQRPDPPYRRIAAEFRARILAGELRAGDRMPSIREIARRWGVAIATATKVMAALRDEGLVEARVGAGTVISARTGQERQVRAPAPVRPRPVGGSRQVLDRGQLLRAAIAIADAEGLDAVTMRRLAADIGVGPMSLYRHVAHKDELVIQMVDEVFGEMELPDPEAGEWRSRLELMARRQWQLCRRHHWMPRAVSFTRPLLVPNMMAHTEWTLRALDGLGLPIATLMREALALHGLVVTAGLSMADEIDAEQDTGVTLTGWWHARRQRSDELLGSGRFPLLAVIPPDVVSDLDGLFEYSLARHLDGFAALVEGRRD